METEHDLTLHLIRHGQTIFNFQDKVQGWSDTPLTEEGRTVAARLGKGLKSRRIDAIYSSDSGRAIETATLIREHSEKTDLELITSKGLREMYFGTFEGGPNPILWNKVREELGQKDREGISRAEAEIDEICQTVSILDPEAEDWKAYTERLFAALQAIVDDALEKGHQDVYIVSHGLSIRVILHVLKYREGYLKIENTSISELLYKAGTFSSFGSINNTELLVVDEEAQLQDTQK
ncbi:histidine phosphatase family protein [Alkalicoccobacillus porphyridii]|uniref:Histidine phosphatase family protein n=1 Tax=Alkalicoccobacillus porphyridii TaxID=2597270 RepID=A0A553ZZI6_9BACI|nr:histidine phosphatase family protein [Alkalicoccobacillus porphyridii]TSB46816.1 histidine phosphatase family protein [Alkalicoccobacillus porphyridii]